MPSFRRPQHSMISGVGVAGAVLSAVVVTFALASGIVAYSLTSVDPPARPSGALVLDAVRPASIIAAKPVVLRRPQPAAAQRRSAPAAGAVRPAPASNRTREPVAGALWPQGGRGSDTKTESQHGGDGAASPAHPAPDRRPKPVGDAIGATSQAVGATTDSLARRLDTVTAAVGAHTAPVARAVEAVADETGDVLRTTADGSGRVVGRLLGDSSPR